MCRVCNGKQYIVSTRSDGRKAVERCDECSVYKLSDEMASILAQRDGINCLSTYPCCVIDVIPHSAD